VLVFMIRWWVPESPRWLIRMGRHEEARKSLAWALMIDPREIELPRTVAASEQTRWLDLFKYPRLLAAGCMTGLTQTGGASLGLWGATLLVVVLNIAPAYAAFLMIFVGVSAIVGRFFITALIEPLGRRGAGTLACVMAALLTVAGGYLYNVFIGSWSVFYMLLVSSSFFSSAIYSVVGPYMAEIWPARLRSSGMGFCYGVGNIGGKVLGPLGLALIMGAGDIIKPAAPNLVMLGPAFVYFASWYLLGVVDSGCLGLKPRAAPSRRWTSPTTPGGGFRGGAGTRLVARTRGHPILDRPGPCPAVFFGSPAGSAHPCDGLTNSGRSLTPVGELGAGQPVPTTNRGGNNSQPGRANAPGRCGRNGMLERLEQQKKLTPTSGS
jgi:putative MFS transporter